MTLTPHLHEVKFVSPRKSFSIQLSDDDLKDALIRKVERLHPELQGRIDKANTEVYLRREPKKPTILIVTNESYDSKELMETLNVTS